MIIHVEINPRPILVKKKNMAILVLLLIWLLAVVRLPHALGDLHVSEDGGERRFLGRAGIDAKADFVGSGIHMADAHLAELGAIGRAFDAIVVLTAREAIPHGFDIGRNGGRCPVGITIVSCH